MHEASSRIDERQRPTMDERRIGSSKEVGSQDNLPAPAKLNVVRTSESRPLAEPVRRCRFNHLTAEVWVMVAASSLGFTLLNLIPKMELASVQKFQQKRCGQVTAKCRRHLTQASRGGGGQPSPWWRHWAANIRDLRCVSW